MAVIDYLDFHDLLLICDEIIPGYQIRNRKSLKVSCSSRIQMREESHWLRAFQRDLPLLP